MKLNNGYFKINSSTNTDNKNFQKEIFKQNFKGINVCKQNTTDCFIGQTFSKETDIFYKRYIDPDKITSSLTPEIKKILGRYGLNSQITQKEIALFDIKHAEETRKYALMMANILNLSDKEKEILSQAAALHDIGKIFIPEEILNKKGKLTNSEKEIIKLHDELGSLLLKSFNLKNDVINLIMQHHSKATNSKLCEILKIADRYSALTSKRVYKKAFSPILADRIIKEEAQKNMLSKEVLTTLKGNLNK